MTADSNTEHFLINNGLKPSVENGEGMLDKEATLHNDCFDAF